MPNSLHSVHDIIHVLTVNLFGTVYTNRYLIHIVRNTADKYLKDQYQYFLAVHTDKGHVHLHCIFNNTNLINGLTFETLENRRYTEKDRSYNKLRTIADEACKRHYLSVVELPEMGKGKSHWEWDMNRQGLSWKAKLKFTIDQVIKESEDFDDFLRKCADFGVLVEYNPDHKIDLKFMLAEQKERNQRAKMTRAKTLGWFYETETIKNRIAQYQGSWIYVPRTKIKERTVKAPNRFVQDAIDRGNMKLASIAKNVIAEYGVEPDQIKQAAISEYAHSRGLLSELNNMKTEIEDLRVKLKVYGEELKALSGSAAKKYRKEHSAELTEYGQIRTKVLELYPSGHILTVESLDKKM